MRTIAKWASAAGVRVLDTEMRDGKWLVSGLGMGTARCPECDAHSSRRHGWRIRHLQDLPVQGAQGNPQGQSGAVAMPEPPLLKADVR